MKILRNLSNRLLFEGTLKCSSGPCPEPIALRTSRLARTARDRNPKLHR